MHKNNHLKNIHLLISTLVVVPVAFIYGSCPHLIFDVSINSIDQANIFKAIMSLYLSFSMLWLLGLLKPSFWKVATLSNMIFMFGLALGRIISLVLDGLPTTIFVIGTIGELVLGLYALYQLKKQKSL